MPSGPCTLDILVENMGRVNYGPDLQDRKGLLGWVRLGINKLYHWSMFPLPLDDLSGLEWSTSMTRTEAGVPRFHRCTFYLEGTGDTFLDLGQWGKGVAWINGFNLGRYWEIGPQDVLYVPAPLLRTGSNELVILELHGGAGGAAFLRSERPRPSDADAS
jgi:beta-galactosidase